jgi:nucleoside-diphosphate-sugar epimerase
MAVTRSPQRAETLRAVGLEPLVADVTRPETLAGLPAAETVLWAVGWDAHSPATRRQLYVEGLGHVLAALPPTTGRIIFISSTGVYGDAGGDWVDEDSPCRPRREAGRALLAAEELLRAHPLGRRAVVLRMAGIYGPGRLLRTAELLAGRPMPVASGSFLNLIHVEDAATAVLAAAARAQPPRTYLICDGQPVERRAYFARAAELLGGPAPQFVEPPLGAADSRHDGSNKRTRNARMTAELGVTLKYANYRAGLRASLSGGDVPLPAFLTNL